MAIVATHVAAVQQLYIAYFGRPADPAGLDYWTNIVEQHSGETGAVSATFATSPEYIVAYYGKTNTQVVDQIYTNLFNRAADSAGRAYWVDLLDKGAITVDTIVRDVANGALTTDAERLENKVAGATAFTAAIDTDAEKAGYSGFEANAEGRKFIASITTDASLTTATAPAALDKAVAAAVKAGTPFSLESAIAEQRTAEKAFDAFAVENGFNPETISATVVEARVTAAETALSNGMPTVGTGDAAVNYKNLYDAAKTDGQRAAVLADAQKALTGAVTAANTDLTAARTAAGAKVAALVDTQIRAETAAEQAAANAQEAGLAFEAASTFVQNQNGGRAVSDFSLTGTSEITIGSGDAATPLIRVNADTGVVTLAPGVTEANYKGVTALLNATKSFLERALVAEGAEEAAKVAADAIPDADQDKANKIIEETGDLAAARDAVTALNKLVADVATAEALVDEFTELDAALTTANADFADAGYLAPEALNAGTPFVAALTGSDIFTLGTADAVTVANFGASGDDVIYVGKNFTFNSGAITTGNDSVMEVFFVQNGNRAEVHVEKAAYGSTSDDTIVISLVGVDAADLQLTDGVISLKDA